MSEAHGLNPSPKRTGSRRAVHHRRPSRADPPARPQARSDPRGHPRPVPAEGFGGRAPAVAHRLSPPYEYDLADRRWLRDAYQRILPEGTEADIVWYIDIDVLLEEWAALHLSPHIRAPWARWLHERGLLGAVCA